MERVEKLVQPPPPFEWGNPSLSTTPTSVAVKELAARVQALENALREIAREAQKRSDQG
jgi:hypothetical protein